MWLIDAAQNARSVGLISDDPLRPTVVTGGVSEQVAFGVTIEPEGGSARPTLPAGSNRCCGWTQQPPDAVNGTKTFGSSAGPRCNAVSDLVELQAEAATGVRGGYS